MIEPVYLGLFRDSTEAIFYAKDHNPTGLYYADFCQHDDSLEPNNFYFWLNDHIPYFGIYIYPKIKLRLNMVALNATYLASHIPYEKGQLLYTSIEEFCSRTIDVNHPATEWLLFNQDLWNDSRSHPKSRV